ncbi:MAG: AAA family ATPase [Proteobacteria bacterium]|nr:AAA family ATPase [Pseudomonadota bacterium]
MSKIIAVAGKGGSGKTTVAALLIRELQNRRKVPILAIDADPVANLGPFLGIKVENTIGAVEQEFRNAREKIPPGMTKASYLEILLNGAIAERNGVDLLVMGRPEGPGCYCSVHNLLREFIEKLSTNYPYLIVDNEAGMEHFSRGTFPRVDHLLLVSDPSRRGIKSVKSLIRLVQDLQLKIPEYSLVVDRTRSGIPPEIQADLNGLGARLLGVIPEDQEITGLDLHDLPITELSRESSAARAFSEICDLLL